MTTRETRRWMFPARRLAARNSASSSKSISAGDQVVVTRIDRLARSTFEFFAIVKRIVDAGGQLLSLAEPWAGTSTSTGRLMIAVLGGLADVVRDLIRTRTGEGRERARALSHQTGAPPHNH